MKHFTDDHVLLQHLKKGDAAAYHHLYKKNKGWLLTTVYNILHDFPEAEEVVQDVFLQVFQSIDGFNGKCSVSSWIYRIAVNKALNRLSHLKSRKRKAFILLGHEELPEQADGPGRSDDSLADLSYQDLIWLVGELPERQRKAFVLCKLQQRSYKEAGSIMNCSIDSIAAMMQRARQHLQQEVTRMTRERAVLSKVA